MSVGKRYPISLLKSMSDTLSHRGPDDKGCNVWDYDGHQYRRAEEGLVGLAHQRLSIIDLSRAGHQPMCNETESLWITYNGEFYNHLSYRKMLEHAGHEFKSVCDTETIIHLYEEMGLAQTLNHMNGMFAFALWNKQEELIYLVRDRLGKKPLYYMQCGDSLFFASEMKALLATGLVDKHNLDLQAIDQFWTFGYATDGRTCYAQIRQLLPGHYARWEKGALSIRPYWVSPFAQARDDAPISESLIDEFEALLADSIRIRMISDRPVGLFLSGGIDSSLIAAVAAKKLGLSLKSFTIAFREEEYNEASQAEAIADHLGIEHVVLHVNTEVSSHFDSIARHFDEPFGDVSCLPTYFLTKLARSEVVVALTGDAGDELFGGYEDYQHGLDLWGPNASWVTLLKDSHSLRHLAGMLRLKLSGPELGYSLLQRHLSSKQRGLLYSRQHWKHIKFHETYGLRARTMKRIESADVLTKMQYADLHTYLPDDVLVKVDRMSMAHGLECRSPFLDYRIVNFASQIPSNLRITRGGRGKHVLRQLLGRYLPDHLVSQRKTGFTPPWAHWCSGDSLTALMRRWDRSCSPLYKSDAMHRILSMQKKPSPVFLWHVFSMVNFLEMHCVNEFHEPNELEP